MNNQKNWHKDWHKDKFCNDYMDEDDWYEGLNEISADHSNVSNPKNKLDNIVRQENINGTNFYDNCAKASSDAKKEILKTWQEYCKTHSLSCVKDVCHDAIYTASLENVLFINNCNAHDKMSLDIYYKYIGIVIKQTYGTKLRQVKSTKIDEFGTNEAGRNLYTTTYTYSWDYRSTYKEKHVALDIIRRVTGSTLLSSDAMNKCMDFNYKHINNIVYVQKREYPLAKPISNGDSIPKKEVIEESKIGLLQTSINSSIREFKIKAKTEVYNMRLKYYLINRLQPEDEVVINKNKYRYTIKNVSNFFNERSLIISAWNCDDENTLEVYYKNIKNLNERFYYDLNLIKNPTDIMQLSKFNGWNVVTRRWGICFKYKINDLKQSLNIISGVSNKQIITDSLYNMIMDDFSDTKCIYIYASRKNPRSKTEF